MLENQESESVFSFGIYNHLYVWRWPQQMRTVRYCLHFCLRGENLNPWLFCSSSTSFIFYLKRLILFFFSGEKKVILIWNRNPQKLKNISGGQNNFTVNYGKFLQESLQMCGFSSENDGAIELNHSCNEGFADKTALKSRAFFFLSNLYIVILYKSFMGGFSGLRVAIRVSFLFDWISLSDLSLLWKYKRVEQQL